MEMPEQRVEIKGIYCFDLEKYAHLYAQMVWIWSCILGREGTVGQFVATDNSPASPTSKMPKVAKIASFWGLSSSAPGCDLRGNVGL
jgi:hypothetical protein